MVQDSATPTAPPGGAVVRVAASGLCRSDWHGWMGHDSDIVRFPHVPGHEFAGTVTEVGAGVDLAWLGRAVTAPFVFACGDCPVCRAGDGQVCPHQRQPGFTDPGSFAEFVVVRAADTNLVALPDDLDPRVAAGLGCRVATAYRAVTARARVRVGDRVLVIGCGGVGLAAIAVAVAAGADVIAVDVDETALATARSLGAADGLVFDDHLADRVHELTDGGADVAIDALGSPATARTGVLALGRRGRHVQVGLLPPAAGVAQIPMERIIGWELELLGSHGMAACDYAPMLDDLSSGGLVLDALLDPRPPLTLEEAAEALPAMGRTPSRGIRLIDPMA
jgi:alcohol dehydrogenase